MRRDIPGVLLKHLTTLAFPWGLDPPLDLFWLIIVLTGVFFALHKRAWRIVFLFVVTLLTLLPVVQLPLVIAYEKRYLYLPFIGSAIGVAVFFEGFIMLANRLLQRRGVVFMTSLALTLTMISGSFIIAESAVNFEGAARQLRLQFRLSCKRTLAFRLVPYLFDQFSHAYGFGLWIAFSEIWR